MFSVLLHSFHKWFSVDQHFLSSFTPTRISKVHASWRFKQTRNFKDFLHALHQSGFFRFWRDTDPENNFFEVRSSLLLRHPVIENCLFQCAVKQPIKLMSWTIFFCANILQKEFNLLQMEQVDLWLHPSLVCEHFLALQCSLTSPLVAKANQFTNLQTHSGLEGICLFRKKAFQFELLFYCLLFAN